MVRGDCSDTERYFREGMLALPTVCVYFMDEWIVRTDTARSGGYHEFDGASGSVGAERYFRETTRRGGFIYPP